MEFVEEEENDKIIKHKKIEIKPMNEEEALLQGALFFYWKKERM